MEVNNLDDDSIIYIQTYANDKSDAMTRATIPVSLPEETVKKLDGARAKLGLRSRNEVIRESIDRFMDEVEGMKIIKLRDVPRQKAKQEILDYIKKKDVTYASDIADDLRLDYKLVVEVVRELWGEKRVEEAR